MSEPKPERVTIVVPTYQEAENLRLLIPQLAEAMKPGTLAYEVIVVDDDSRDGTEQVVAALAEDGYPVRLITRVGERGLSSAVIRGFREAEGDILVCMDADLSHPPEAVPRMLDALSAPGVEFVIGSRYIRGGSTDEAWGLFRWLNSRAATLLARPFTRAKDPMAGFFALRRSRFEDAAPLGPVGYKIGLELIVKCGCRQIREVPIHFADRRIGQSKLNIRQQLNYIRHLKRLADFKYGAFFQFIQFCFVGATGVVVDLGSLGIFLAWSMPLEYARALSIFIAMTWNFALNRRLTFSYSRGGNILTQYVRFILSCTVGNTANWCITMSLARWGASPPLLEHEFLASFVGIGVGLVFNFAFSRFWVFRRPVMGKRTSILCIAPFNNPHIVPVYDAMAAQEDVEVVRVSLRPLRPSRLDLGWTEMPPDLPYLQPWRRWSDRWRYFKAMLRSDIVVFPGFAHFRTLPLHHWLRRLTFKPTVLWSEPFAGHPRSKGRSRLYRLFRRVMFKSIDSPKYTLLATGHDAERDFYRLGIRKWCFRRFAFAVEPPEAAAGPPPERPHGDVRILYVGALVRRKGVDVLIDALGTERLRAEPWRLTVVGQGDQQDALAAQAESLGIAEKVTFAGALPRTRCEEAYRAADVLVLPSRFDGWGAVVNEAMEHGLAVIASDQVGARTPLVAEGLNGFVFSSESAADLASCLAGLVGDRKRLAEMKRAGRERIQLFRPGEVARRLAAVCRGLAGDAPMPDYDGELCGLVHPEIGSP